eukprot:TRINITY_DN22680_c0_g1_i1.p1 TRINITY_DN22680_c0_g1~~TRINITY_DN22680_c0_g1_i1.p1  ORF type:complete len:290 (+),score=91.08 TRINITY_DN22680_c0_g1_i1:43-912(+)
MRGIAGAVRRARGGRAYCAPTFAPPGFAPFGADGGGVGAGAVGLAMVQKKRAREAAAREAAASLRALENAVEIDVDMADAAALVHFGGGAAQAEALRGHVQVIPEFVTADEAAEVEQVIDGHLGAAAWESAHIDSLIRSYREMYVDCAAAPHPALQRLQEHLQRGSDVPMADFFHFLEYKPEGYVRPHLDNPAESSHIVAGLSLGDARVMTLTLNGAAPVQLLLPPRSLYVLSGPCRYEWLHAIDYRPGAEIHNSPRIHFRGGVVKGWTRGVRRCVVMRGKPRPRGGGT